MPAGAVCDAVATMMDWLPTLAGLTGAALPPEPIDGHDLWPVLTRAPGAQSAYDEMGFCYYFREQLQAVRWRQWKLYLPLEHKQLTLNPHGPRAACAAELYDVAHDLGETREVASERPEVVAHLLALAERAREELGDEGREGWGQRPAGWVETPTARVRPK